MNILKRIRDMTASAAKRTAGSVKGAWQYEQYDKTSEYKDARRDEEKPK